MSSKKEKEEKEIKVVNEYIGVKTVDELLRELYKKHPEIFKDIEENEHMKEVEK